VADWDVTGTGGHGGGLVMDAVSIGAVLAAITAGAGEELGGQLWAGICALVRRNHRPGLQTVGGGSAGALDYAPVAA
jgi:hypothetical protein